MGATGLEPTPESSGKTGDSAQGGALCGAPGDLSTSAAHSDPDLLAVVRAWPSLSAEARQAVLAIIDGAKG